MEVEIIERFKQGEDMSRFHFVVLCVSKICRYYSGGGMSGVRGKGGVAAER